jgi:hypothetical protein
VSIFCSSCGRVVPGKSSCPSCGTTLLFCGDCRHYLTPGSSSCSNCMTAMAPSAPQPTSLEAPPLPDLPATSLVVPVVPAVVERYSGGRHGVEAEVTIPARDVEVMNELAQLVPLLHLVAGHMTNFTGLTDHTRKLIREMRVLAADAQEEIEMRRGPR